MGMLGGVGVVGNGVGHLGKGWGVGLLGIWEGVRRGRRLEARVAAGAGEG
ncbi:glycosyl hydrolase [Sesbania bispinosa]|nr:glycosyl hydrolase [Sesbania bispinosa]